MEFFPVAAHQTDPSIHRVDHPLDGLVHVGMLVMAGTFDHLSLDEHIAQSGQFPFRK